MFKRYKYELTKMSYKKTDTEESDEEFDIEDEEEFVEIDGDYEIEEYSENYEPFENYFKASQRRICPPKPVQIIGEYAKTLSDVFDSKMEIFKIPLKYRLSENITIKPKQESSRLCRSMLTNHSCSFGKQCKFAHSFNSITKCKFDYCKKTKLIGNGLFKNISSYPCMLRHNLETLDSFIFRNKEYTSLPIKLEIYAQFLDEFKDILKTTKFSKIEIVVL